MASAVLVFFISVLIAPGIFLFQKEKVLFLNSDVWAVFDFSGKMSV